MSRAEEAELDALVLGGGPAGCAVAVALRREGVARVRLAEGTAYRERRVGETIPPDARLLLDELGVWDAFRAEGHEPCPGSRAAWGDARAGHNDYVLNPFGHGWHLDRPRFDRFLAERAAAAGARVTTGTRFAGAEPMPGGGFRVALAGEAGTEVVRARYVVDATGVRCVFARRMGARRLVLDRLTFVCGFFEGGGAAASRLTTLEAAEYGWWYAVRLPGGRAAAAVGTDPETLRGLGLHRPRGWRRGLGATTHVSAQVAGARLVPASLTVAPAPSFRLDPTAGPGWIAVGDAAAAYDPLAGQGIYKALSDGVTAARVAAAALRGDDSLRARYQAWVADRFERFRASRDRFYRTEARWPDAPFWARRRAGGAAAAAAVS